MQNTRMIMTKMIETLNTNPACKEMMETLANKAIEKELTEDEWNGFKQELFLHLFVKLVNEHDDIKKAFVEDIYNTIGDED